MRFYLLTCLVVITLARGSNGLIDSLLGKKCTVDADCEANECCTPTLSMGDRCRGHMTEGTICSSFTEELIKRLHRRCPCEAGTSCKRTGSILGIYKINRCVKDEA